VEINQYIKELLLLNDCVIIPQFGGFVANYKTATIENNIFFPPSKEIAFNNKLVSNDGLLINYISDCERIDYYSAKQKLESFVEETLLNLEKNRNVYFDGIGYLHYDSRENLLFEPQLKQNLLVEAYGLQNFSYERLYQRQVPKPAFKVEQHEPTPIALPQRHRLRKSVVAVPLLLALALIPIKNNKEYLSKSDMGLWEALTQNASIDPDLVNDQLVITDSLDVNVPVNMDSTRMDVSSGKSMAPSNESNVPTTTHSAPVVSAPVAAPKATVAVKKVEAEQFPYYIIGGSFKSEVNANKYIREIKEYGYTGRNLGIFKGLHRVAVKGFATMEEAQEELNTIRFQNPQSDAWIQAPE